MSEMNQIRARLHQAQGGLNYDLEVFGDELAHREGYKAHDGMDAVHFYVVNKHGWLPRDVRSMSPEDLRWVLAEEMNGWTLPADARKYYKLD